METNTIVLNVKPIEPRFVGSPLWALLVAIITLAFLAAIFGYGYRVGTRRAIDSTRVGSAGWEAHTWQQLYDRHMRQNHPETPQDGQRVEYEMRNNIFAEPR